jgi:energy-coupling factor transporter ATP-binding protein EcfA2
MTAEGHYFLSLEVENILCFSQRQTLDLSRDGKPCMWNVILGDNGTGKTTLLTSLANMRATLYPPSPEEDAPSLGVTGDYKSNLWMLARSPDAKPILSALYCSSQGIRSIRPPEQFNLRLTGGTGRGCTMMMDHAYMPGSGAMVLWAYGASRRMAAVSLSDRPRPTQAQRVSDPEAVLFDAEETIIWADYEASKAEAGSSERKQAATRLEALKDVILKALPPEDATDLRIIGPKGGKSEPRVEVRTPYGWVPLRKLSLGYQTMVAWVTDFAVGMYEQYPDSPNPLAEPAVCLVDEIDLHLHPRWQRRIMGYLSERFPNTQFIVTAHSPLIVQAAQDANVVLLRRQGDHVVIDNDVETIKGWRIDQVLASDLFGVSARPPEAEEKIEQRKQLLMKTELTPDEKKRLAELDEEVGSLPTAETPAEIRAMKVIQDAARYLEESRGK